MPSCVFEGLKKANAKAEAEAEAEAKAETEAEAKTKAKTEADTKNEIARLLGFLGKIPDLLHNIDSCVSRIADLEKSRAQLYKGAEKRGVSSDKLASLRLIQMGKDILLKKDLEKFRGNHKKLLADLEEVQKKISQMIF